MKSIIISPHSFVDLITNSSSELFICDTKKSIDTVKEIIVELVKITNQKLKLKDCEEYSISSIFTDMFKEPEIFQFNFPDIQESHDLRYLQGYNLDETCQIYADCHDSSVKWERKNPTPEFPHHVYPDYPTDEEQAPYHAEMKLYTPFREKAMAKIWKPFHMLHNKAYKKCLDAYCKLNDIDPSEIEFETIKPSRYPRCRAKAGKHDVFIREFDDAISWEYTVKKGDIVLFSQMDNSVPYELFEDLEDILNAQRVHLG